MSDENNNAVPSLEEHVTAELEAAQKSFRVSVVAFAIIGIVFIGYFQWLKAQVSVILDPPALAATLVNESVRVLPLLQDNIEASLTATIPSMAQEVMDITVKESVPSLRQNAVSEFNAYSDQLTKTGSVATTEAFEQMIKDNPQAYEQVADCEPNTTGCLPPTLNLDRLVDLEMDRCRNALACQRMDKKEKSKEAKCATEAEDLKTCANRTAYKEDAAQSLEASRLSLQNINERLQSDAEAKRKDRKSVLTYKLVTAWYSMVKADEEPSLSAASQGLQPKQRDDLK